MKVCVSGIQPSGHVGIGNYLGAVQTWLQLQSDYTCYFFVADLHALSVPQDPSELQKSSRDLMAFYLACGLVQESNVLFIQSQVSAHAELCWLLHGLAYHGELSRMTQFKDKSLKQGASIPAGLFNYPILMAADVILYGAHVVPVGDDQKQHLELVRNIVQRLNSQYGLDIPVPEPYMSEMAGRIMGLQTPEKKMSKSDDNKNNAITFFDEPKVIRKKIMRSVTDSESGIAYEPVNRPGLANLINIYSAFADLSIESICLTCQDMGYGEFKGKVADAVLATMEPIQERMQAFRNDTDLLDEAIQHGAVRAREAANKSLQLIKQKMGLVI